MLTVPVGPPPSGTTLGSCWNQTIRYAPDGLPPSRPGLLLNHTSYAALCTPLLPDHFQPVCTLPSALTCFGRPLPDAECPKFEPTNTDGKLVGGPPVLAELPCCVIENDVPLTANV